MYIVLIDMNVMNYTTLLMIFIKSYFLSLFMGYTFLANEEKPISILGVASIHIMSK